MEHAQVRAAARGRATRRIAIVIALALAGLPAAAQVQVRGFGGTRYDSVWNERTFVAIGAGDSTSLAVLGDGSCAAFGDNDDGECTVSALPSGLTYTAVAGGSNHGVGLRSDGSIAHFPISKPAFMAVMVGTARGA